MKGISRRDFLASSAAAGAVASVATTDSAKAQSGIQNGIFPENLFPSKPINRGDTGQLPPFGVRVLNKAGFGPARGDLAAFNALGANDTQRLQAWVDDQINPAPADPEVDTRLSGMTAPGQDFDTINKTDQQLWLEHVRYEGPDEFATRVRPLAQMERLVLLRGAYSQWQLREVLADFWHNHFHIFGILTNETRGYMPAYDRDIREHMFGNFFDMLLNNTRNASMLFYLDNFRNSWPNPNENYAREVLELHTLGAVENYYGAVAPVTVPDNSEGQRAGYTEIDVFQFARALTGWGVADGDDGAADTGEFLFRPARHYDFSDGPIQVMDINIASDGGENDVIQILQYLANHFGTARFIASKLCQRFIGDEVSPGLVDTIANEFYNRRADADQLREVYRAILTSNEFQNAWGGKARRPLETVLRAWRAADVDMTPGESNGISGGILGRLDQAGQRPWDIEPPTGFPDFKEFWQGTGTLIGTWRTVTYLLTRDNILNLAVETNGLIPAANQRTPTNIANSWFNTALGFFPEPAVITEVVQFISNIAAVGVDEPLDNAGNIDTTNISNGSRYQRILRAAVGLIIMLPVGQRR